MIRMPAPMRATRLSKVATFGDAPGKVLAAGFRRPLVSRNEYPCDRRGRFYRLAHLPEAFGGRARSLGHG